MNSTQGIEYTTRLSRLSSIWWKRWIDVQAPYRWNLRRLKLGFTLDIGCGIGRHLVTLGRNGIGVDQNKHSVDFCQSLGLRAYTPNDLRRSGYFANHCFDSLLLSHVVEHTTLPQAVRLIWTYLPVLRPQGRVVFITPQERGFASDPTHVQFMSFEQLHSIAEQTNLEPVRDYSFPLPRWVGKVFPHNEFISIKRKCS